MELTSAQFNPGELVGQSFTNIAPMVGNNSTQLGADIDASAKVLVQTICSVLTDNQPGGACAAPWVMAERHSPRWPGLIGTVASVAGLGVAGYLTYEHFTGSSSLVCSDKGIVNCLAVTTSSYAMVAGVPVAVLGLIFFAVALLLQLPVMWRWPNPIIRRARLAWAVVGLGTVIYLPGAELFEINAICLGVRRCTS